MLKTSDYLLCKTLYILNLHNRSAGLQLPWLYFILTVAQRPAAMIVLNHYFSTSALQPIIVYPHLCARSKLDMRALKSSPPTTLHRFFENEKNKGRTLPPFLKKLPRDQCYSVDLTPCSWSLWTRGKSTDLCLRGDVTGGQRWSLGGPVHLDARPLGTESALNRKEFIPSLSRSKCWWETRPIQFPLLF